MTIHNKIKALREGRDWTQAHLASRVNVFVGGQSPVSRQHVFKWEDSTTPSARYLRPLAVIFETTVDALLGDDE